MPLCCFINLGLMERLPDFNEHLKKFQKILFLNNLSSKKKTKIILNQIVFTLYKSYECYNLDISAI